jgi:hypothetical protein
MAWNSYGLDREAQELVLSARQRDSKSLNQGYKMRMAVAYGLERFWGEHLRLQNKEPEKSQYWKETWDTLVKVMKNSGVTIPNHPVNIDRTSEIKAMSEALWKLEPDVQRVALAVLTQLCDCVIWWTQRYKVGSDSGEP